jgi:hypothetical protein
MNDMQKLINKIRQHKINTIKFCYYPFCDKSNRITKLKNMTQSNIKCILKGIDIDQHINGNYTEYGVRDTFMRAINISENNKNGRTYVFFRRQIHIIRLENDEGLFVVELHTQCDEEDIPIIIDYPHFIQCNVDTYIIMTDNDILRMCFTKIEDSKCILSKETTYLNICRDISINNTTDINNEYEKFFKDVVSLKNRYDKNFSNM